MSLLRAEFPAPPPFLEKMQSLCLMRYHDANNSLDLTILNGYTYKYPRPMVTVDAVVFAGGAEERQIALIRRKHDPFGGYWALPGGFVDMDEPLDAAVARELREETGLHGLTLTQFHTFGDPGRDPRGRSISVAFYGVLSAPAPLAADDDAADAAWFPVAQLPSLAFDHDAIIAFAIPRIRG